MPTSLSAQCSSQPVHSFWIFSTNSRMKSFLARRELICFQTSKLLHRYPNLINNRIGILWWRTSRLVSWWSVIQSSKDAGQDLEQEVWAKSMKWNSIISPSFEAVCLHSRSIVWLVSVSFLQIWTFPIQKKPSKKMPALQIIVIIFYVTSQLLSCFLLFKSLTSPSAKLPLNKWVKNLVCLTLSLFNPQLLLLPYEESPIQV